MQVPLTSGFPMHSTPSARSYGASRIHPHPLPQYHRLARARAGPSSPGISVSTTTVDARGWDQRGERVAERGNPDDGSVLYQRTLNRATPWWCISTSSIPTAIGAGRVGQSRPMCWTRVLQLGLSREEQPLRWPIDLAAGTTTQPDTLPGLVLPLNPMVGCFGVAPPRGQAISTATSSDPRRQHGLPGLCRRRDRLSAGRGPGGAFPSRRRARHPGRRRDRRHRRGNLL